MASTLRPFALRHGLLTSFKPPILLQRRAAQALDVRFVATRTSPLVLEKYRQKLEEKIKQEGVGSFEELREAYKDKIEKMRREASVELPRATAAAVEAGLAQPPPPVPKPVGEIERAARTVTGAPPGIKTLAGYVDVEKLLTLPPKEIEFIWRARFVNDTNSLCAIIPQEKYSRMEADAKKHPMFILPLPREGQGIEMQFLQWSFPSHNSSTIIFTSLEEYRLRGEFAVPHITLTHHLDLAEDKKLILAQGSVNKDSGVSADEARWLVIALQKFYGAKEDSEVGRRRRGMLEMFTGGDQRFKVEELINEVEMIE